MSEPRPSASFREDSIRPDVLMDESDRLHEQDLARLLAKRERFVEVPCPACGSGERDPLWRKDGFDFWTCRSCATAYLSPRPTEADLDEYYRTAENYRYWSEKVFPASEAARRQNIVLPRVRRIVEICDRQGVPPGATLVEVGAGHGTFCDEAQRNGRFGRVLAIEPTPSNAASCRARGLEVIARPIEQVPLQTLAADVLVSFEVIEHLFSPRRFLESCSNVIRPGGLLVLSCPNGKGFEVAVLGTGSRTVDAEHLNYFHPRSLQTLLESTGFQMLEIQTPGKLDAEIVRKRALTGHLDLDTNPFLRTMLVEEWERLAAPLQQFLEDNHLSAHMWAVARRP